MAVLAFAILLISYSKNAIAFPSLDWSKNGKNNQLVTCSVNFSGRNSFALANDLPFRVHPLRICVYRVNDIRDSQRLGEPSKAVKVPSTAAPFGLELSVGVAHVCVLSRDGSIVCWGGLGDAYGSIQPPEGLVAKSIVAGFYHECAVTAGGGVVCWGDNQNGETKPPLPALRAGVRELIAGYRGSCARLIDGTIKCWGIKDIDTISELANSDSPIKSMDGLMVCATHLGNLQCYDIKEKERISVFFGVKSTIASFSEPNRSRVCALFNDSALRCFIFRDASIIEVAKYFPGEVEQLADTGEFLCALLKDGKVECALPTELIAQLGPVTPMPPAGLRAVRLFPGKHWNMCALTDMGKVECWNQMGRPSLEKGKPDTLRQPTP